MTRTEIIVAAVIILLAAWLLMPPPVAPDGAPADVTPVVCKAADCRGPLVITATPRGYELNRDAARRYPVVVAALEGCAP